MANSCDYSNRLLELGYKEQGSLFMSMTEESQQVNLEGFSSFLTPDISTGTALKNG